MPQKRSKSEIKAIPEALIQNQILEWLQYQPKCMAWRNNNTGLYDPRKKIFIPLRGKFRRKGISDILGIWKTRPLAIEVKSAKGKLSRDQFDFLDQFEFSGGIAIVARSLDDVIVALSKI